MVQVVNKEPHPSVAKDTFCRNCGVTLRYTPNDVIKIKTNHDYLGGFDVVDAIKCPNCEKETQL